MCIYTFCHQIVLIREFKMVTSDIEILNFFSVTLDQFIIFPKIENKV